MTNTPNPQQDAVIASQYPHVQSRILARQKVLDGRSASGVRNRASRLGIRSGRYHCWTGKELRFLRIALRKLSSTLGLRPSVIARRLVEIAKEMESAN